MRIGPLEFSHPTPSPLPWRHTQAWVVPEPGSKPDQLDAWTIQLERPDDGTPHLAVHDLKRWMLFGDDDERYLSVPGSTSGRSGARRIRREKACYLYLQATLAAARTPSARVCFLMPALRDDAAHSRYRAMLRRVDPEARIVPEPEMVAEYFRLVRQELHLPRDRNSVVLVIDAGASTINLSMITSNRGEIVGVGKQEGRQRIKRLRAIRGTVSDSAGQWIDERLAAVIGLELGKADDNRRFELLREVEEAKILVSRTQDAALVRGGELTFEMLGRVAEEVAEQLEPELSLMQERLWVNQTEGEEALRLSEAVRDERGISGPAEALAFVDYVIFAGGTSLLPGFQPAVLRHFKTTSPEVLEVGDSFAVAAAVGALAHVLNSYKPKHIRGANGSASEDVEPELVGGLEQDVFLGWKSNRKNKAKEKQAVLLEAGDPIIYTGGRKPAVERPHLPKHRHIPARLSVPFDPKVARAGQRFVDVLPTTSAPQIDVLVDKDHEVRIESDGIRNSAALFLNLDRPVSKDPPRTKEPLPAGTVAIDSAPELIVDFGMSKTVLLGAPRSGILEVSDLDRKSRPTAQPEEPPRESPVPPPEPSLPPDAEGDVDGGVSPDREPETDADPAGSAEGGSDHGGDVEPSSPDGPAVGGSVVHLPGPADPEPARDDGGLGDAEAYLAALEQAGIRVPAADFLMALIGLSVRPLLLLSGPPGCGKSMLAKVLAKYLGYIDQRSFHEVPVQAHWQNDDPLFGAEGVLKEVVGDETPAFVLFDEFNITRPEYYLTRLFRAVERDRQLSPAARVPSMSIVGTLNIDDTSRPPSPKVLDRCFLVEIDAAPKGSSQRTATDETILALPSRPRPTPLRVRHKDGAEAQDETVEAFVTALYEVVDDKGLRSDLLPSRRVQQDISQALRLHAELGPGLTRYLDRAGLVDRLLASRVLTKLSGPAEQLMPAVDRLEAVLGEGENLKRCRQRLRLARLQSRMGFISPWQ